MKSESSAPYSPTNLPEPPFSDELLNSLDDATFKALLEKYWQPPEKQETWSVQFPDADPEDQTPFPTHNPDDFPAPSRPTRIPSDLSSSHGYTADDYLAIAKQKDPFWMLPKTKKGIPNRGKFSIEQRRIYRNIVTCIHRAHGLAGRAREHALEQAQRELDNSS